VSKPQVIKVSPKSDMAIIWIDIWNVQSSSNVKMLINRCFNVGNYITTIREANINPGIPNVRIVGDETTQHLHVEFKGPNVSNTTVLTN